jgi:DNA-binding response OmpR family regulator
VLSRERLLKDVWGYPRVPEGRTVDVHVARLRERLEVDRARPRHFLTLRGRGYRFVPDASGRPAPGS